MCIGKKDNRREKRDEFRTCFSRKYRHVTYIYAKKNGKYSYIGLTHAEITDNIRNIPLEQNPNPKDNRASFMRPTADTEKVTLFEKKPKKDWHFSKTDKKKAKAVIKRSKKKRK